MMMSSKATVAFEIDAFIGDRLCRARQEAELSTEDVAAALKIEASEYQAFESGGARPTPEQIFKAANLIGVSVASLFSGIVEALVRDRLATDNIVPFRLRQRRSIR